MRICGFNKTTLLDYPGKVASTIFLGGCNFRCPFCQNSVLVTAPGEQPDYAQEELLAFLQKRKGILDGVCISGGEPTLSDGLEEFIVKIKELGYAVKLDTNGSRPEIVKHLAEAGLIDKVAMDIKACQELRNQTWTASLRQRTFYFMENWTMNFVLQLCGNCIRRKILKKLQSGLRERKNITSRPIRTRTES